MSSAMNPAVQDVDVETEVEPKPIVLSRPISVPVRKTEAAPTTDTDAAFVKQPEAAQDAELEAASSTFEATPVQAAEAVPAPVADVDPVQTQRPRVVLMGEFSAGKSTLSNLLIGKAALPVNVTATQLPPIWMSYGSDAPYRVDVNGVETDDVDPSLEGISVVDTNHLRIFHTSKFLKLCDLIDMPGISDPNMAADVWQRVIHNADIVIWCSHATQAWRQSEAAVWATMPAELHDKSILLLTRMDRILSDRDRVRVIKRVESETKGLFRKVLPVSLIKAIEAKNDPEAWADSGADELLELLVSLIDEVAGDAAGKPRTRTRSIPSSGGVDSSIGDEVVQKPARVVLPTRVRPRPLISKPQPR